MKQFTLFLVCLLAGCLAAYGQMPFSSTNKQVDSPPAFNPAPRYMTVGVGWGYGHTQENGIGQYASLSVGLFKRIGRTLQAGLSASYIERVAGEQGVYQDNTLPIALETRWLFSQSRSGRFSSYLGLSTGWNRVLNRSYFARETGEEVLVGDGVLISPLLSFQANFASNAGLIFDAGYRYGSNTHRLAATDEIVEGAPTSHFFLRGNVFF